MATKGSKKQSNKGLISEKDIMKLLDACYEKSLNGVPKVSKSVEELADEYLKKYKTKEEACNAMLKNQIRKCATSGFLTGFGGIITIPVTLPANVTSVLYVQMRMIACTAYISGYDVKSDQTQTLVYACLAGVSVNELIKQATIKFGVKFANALIKKIPGKVLTKINQKVGFRLVTKFGTKGIVNLGKLVPGVGAVIGGSLDYVETKVIAKRAYKWFTEGDFTTDEEKEEVIDIDASELEEVSSEENDAPIKSDNKIESEATDTEKNSVICNPVTEEKPIYMYSYMKPPEEVTETSNIDQPKVENKSVYMFSYMKPPEEKDVPESSGDKDS